jgi:alanyl-tRNA synthetase
MIRAFKVVSESGVSAGVRRIEAITGDTALHYLLRNTHENQRARAASGYQSSWTHYMNDGAEKQATVSDWIEHAKMTIRGLEREIKSLKGSSVDIDSLVRDAKVFAINGANSKLVTAALELEDRQLLSEISDKIRDKIQSGVVVLVGKGEGKHPITVAVSKDLTKSLSAGKLLSEIAPELKGKGGGRPDFAQGAGEDLSGLSAAFKKAASLVGLH